LTAVCALTDISGRHGVGSSRDGTNINLHQGASAPLLSSANRRMLRDDDRTNERPTTLGLAKSTFLIEGHRGHRGEHWWWCRGAMVCAAKEQRELQFLCVLRALCG